MRHEKYLNGFSVYLALGLVFLCGFDSWGVPRGSGSNTTLCIGSPCDQLYLPVSKEEEGWGDGSTQSINNNFLKISSAIFRIETQASSTNYIQLRGTLQSGATFYVSSASVDGQALLARTSGNVGIGTAVPGSILQINQNTTEGMGIDFAAGRLRIINDGAQANPRITTSDGTNLSIYTQATSSITLLTGSVERLRIESGGNVGIATATPQGLLQVGGGGAPGLIVLSGGNVGVGTTNPTSKFHVSGGSITIEAGSAGGLIYGTTMFVLAPGGNVGISTTTPIVRLEVVDNGAAGAGLVRFTHDDDAIYGLTIANKTAITGAINGDEGLLFQHTNAGMGRIEVHDGASYRDLLLSPVGGNVGISSSTPTALLVVGSGGTTNLNYTTDPFLEPGQHSNCATATPRRVGAFCAQNSATQPIWIATATTPGGFQPLTMAAE